MYNAACICGENVKLLLQMNIILLSLHGMQQSRYQLFKKSWWHFVYMVFSCFGGWKWHEFIVVRPHTCTIFTSTFWVRVRVRVRENRSCAGVQCLVSNRKYFSHELQQLYVVYDLFWIWEIICLILFICGVAVAIKIYTETYNLLLCLKQIP